VKHKNIRQLINEVQEFLDGRSDPPSRADTGRKIGTRRRRSRKS
jgi:hypothetical protein